MNPKMKWSKKREIKHLIWQTKKWVWEFRRLKKYDLADHYSHKIKQLRAEYRQLAKA